MCITVVAKEGKSPLKIFKEQEPQTKIKLIGK